MDFLWKLPKFTIIMSFWKIVFFLRERKQVRKIKATSEMAFDSEVRAEIIRPSAEPQTAYDQDGDFFFYGRLLLVQLCLHWNLMLFPKFFRNRRLGKVVQFIVNRVRICCERYVRYAFVNDLSQYFSFSSGFKHGESHEHKNLVNKNCFDYVFRIFVNKTLHLKYIT